MLDKNRRKTMPSTWFRWIWPYYFRLNRTIPKNSSFDNCRVATFFRYL